MKKVLTVTLFILSATLCFGQLKVDSVGNVGVNVEPAESCKLSVSYNGATSLSITNNNTTSSATSLYSYVNQTIDSIAPKGINSVLYTSGYGVNSTSVYGYSRSLRSGRVIGVWGAGSILSSSYSTSNNYGVVGTFGNSTQGKGAGIYGASNATILTLNKQYAGYFYGPVGIQGNLTVTGYISGVVLSSAPSALPSHHSRRPFDADDLSSRLSSLELTSYYVDTPSAGEQEFAFTPSAGTERHNVSNSSDTPTGGNVLDDALSDDPSLSRAAEKEMSMLEAQIYSKKHYGLNAEELEEVFPDLVYEGEDGTKSINYVEMVPLLVQAIKELKAEISELKGETDSSKKAKGQATALSDTAEEVTLLSLGQNNPNPFGETTSIAVSVPDDVQTAFLYVYNLNGSKVAQVDIPARGVTSVTLSAATLSEGMYLYSLVVDGKIVQTRRMIVEK